MEGGANFSEREGGGELRKRVKNGGGERRSVKWSDTIFRF